MKWSVLLLNIGAVFVVLWWFAAAFSRTSYGVWEFFFLSFFFIYIFFTRSAICF